MAGTALVGKDCKVTIGSDQILGIGTVTMSGVTTDQLDTTEFGEDWKSFKLGLKDGGEISFSGFYDKADTTGQTYLRTANLNDTEITDFRVYVSPTSYWVPSTTNPASYVVVTSWSIGAEMAGIVSAEFAVKVSGRMQLL